MGEIEEPINATQLEQLNEQLSDEEKQGNIGKVLNYTLTALKTGWSLLRATQDVKKLQDVQKYKEEVGELFDKLIQENTHCKERVVKAFEEHSERCSEWFSPDGFSPGRLCENISKDKGSSVEKLKESVLKAIDDHHRIESNKAIKSMVKGSSITAALYVLKLYIAWKRISAASNVIKDKHKFVQIENNIKELEEMVASLVTICSTNPRHESISNRMTLINTTYVSTLSLISDVRVKIDGHIQSLDLLGDVAAVDSVMSFGTATAQGYEVWSAWRNLDLLTKGLGIASTALFTLIGVANAGVCILSRQMLKQLREDLNQVNRFKCELDQLHMKAKRAITEI